MTVVLLLLLASAIAGLAMGPRYDAYMLVGSAPILAVVAATVARFSDFGLLQAVAMAITCVTVSQIAYLLAAWLSMRDADLRGDDATRNRIRE